jgi:hypothetical protein
MPCAYCGRALDAGEGFHLPDSRDYCADCCDAMAADAFQMETGEPFTAWIPKHGKLTMRYQPMELSARSMGFWFPAVCAAGSSIATLAGIVLYLKAGFPLVYLLLEAAPVAGIVVVLAVLFRREEQAPRGAVAGFGKVIVALLAAAVLCGAVAGMIQFGKPAALMAIGGVFLVFFAGLALNGLGALLRAQDFELTLEDGVFNLRHGAHRDTFTIDTLNQACVVRPGTVGAMEGALGLSDGRMLTLDTCLSDLHALGVVMDLHFKREFPPSLEDLAEQRRVKLRKIRGLS